ncbi:CopD family protein [Phenylobacterium sp.]|uniref:CopD family protein n=1 Tax=Phenylobacterium sp. TaxID=1871053 RepID=UPI0025F40276|nr:CopD family protein [Phenylobacterium sp.]MCA3722268.1 CopD family protein [Phenylobacterium sp.]
MNAYDLLRGLHILAVIAWMAGLLYLPRLFAYHTDATPGSEMDLTFQTMELKLYRIIMGPAMVATLVLGLALIWFNATARLGGWDFLLEPWMGAKLAGVVFLIGWHHFLGASRKRFAAGTNTRSNRFWRATNELPFLAAIVMVLAATLEFGR